MSGLTPTQRRYLFWTVFILSHIGLFVYGFLRQKNDPGMKKVNTIGYTIFVSRGAGLVITLDVLLVLLPMCRNLITVLRSFSILNSWIDFDETLFLHRVSAISMLVFTVIHTNGHYNNFFGVEEKLYSTLRLKAWQMHYASFAGITGHVMLLCMFMMFTAAYAKVKALKFEVFWFTHHLYIVFFGMFIFHSFGCFFKSSITNQCRGYNSDYYLIPVLILFFIEKDLRIWRSRVPIDISSAIFHPGNTLELRFEKPGMKYLPGQYLFICVPKLSGVQWHPFTISSAPDEGFVSVHIKQIGDWTKALGKLLQDCELDPMAEFPKILVDGPYGAPAQDIFKYETCAMVSAGIGVTPAASLLKAVFFNFRNGTPMKLKKMCFIWIARDKQDFEWFQALLGTLEQSVPRDFLEIQIYLTGKLDMDDIHNIALNDGLRGGVDPVTELSTRCRYGRPQWDNIFRSFKETQFNPGKKTRMGIFYCGPNPLAVTLSEACKRQSEARFEFELRKEHF